MNARVSTLLLAVLTLAACGGSAPPAAKKSAAAKAPAAADTKAAAPSVTLTVPYAYSPVGKRDPFRSPVEDFKEKDASCQDALCQWELDQVTLVAVVTGDATPIAMVEDPQGRGHIVKRGSRVGKQGGKVTQILRDQITVTEYWRQPDGKTTPNPVQLQLKQTKSVIPAQDLSTGQDM